LKGIKWRSRQLNTFKVGGLGNVLPEALRRQRWDILLAFIKLLFLRKWNLNTIPQQMIVLIL